MNLFAVRSFIYPAAVLAMAFVLPSSFNSPADIIATRLPREVIKAGYTRKIFEDDFLQLDLGKSDSKWHNGLWYEADSPIDQIRVAEGVLTLLTPPGTLHTSITTVPKSGVGGATFRSGFFEARMRFSNDEADWSAFWLFSRPHSLGTDGDHWCEIDIFENFGANVFVGSVHDWTKKSHSRNANAYHRLWRKIDFSAWHNYGLLWEPEKLTWFLDGETVLEARPPKICEEQDLFIILGSQKHKDGSTQQLNVDWVRVLSR